MKSSNFICTIKPSNSTAERIERMIYKGMSVARLNLSRGNHEDHLETLKSVRKAAGRISRRTNFISAVAIAVELRGPEIRTGIIEQPLDCSRRPVEAGEFIKLNESLQFAESSAPDMIYIDQPIAGLLKKGIKIFINDGVVELKVEDIFGDVVTCSVVEGGILKSNQSVFIPDIAQALNLPVVSDEDKANIEFAVEHDVDFIFASHVEKGEWIDEIRNIFSKSGVKIKVFAKIQNRLGVESIKEIATKADGIIFAPTMDLEPTTVPFLQRFVLRECQKVNTPCFITIENEMNSCEIYQATNWFLVSGDGVILTGELSAGKTKPLESMSILRESKPNVFEFQVNNQRFAGSCSGSIADSLASACVSSSMKTNAAAIIIISESDEVVQLVNQYRPNCDVIVVMENLKSCRQLNILDRVTPLLYETAALSKIDFGIKFAKLRGITKCGDSIVILQHDLNQMIVHYLPYDRR